MSDFNSNGKEPFKSTEQLELEALRTGKAVCSVVSIIIILIAMITRERDIVIPVLLMMVAFNSGESLSKYRFAKKKARFALSVCSVIAVAAFLIFFVARSFGLIQ